MPISAIDGCTEHHWSDVVDIISEAIEEAGFEPNIVSNADDVGVIHKRIIQNLYDNPVVVCDVSGKNPNVMFELGVRLAFDKPTIIIKDDKTTYSFDTAAIEHLEYPRDLRFSKIVEFKQKLAEKIKNTHSAATTDPNYTTFLKHFGEFTVAKLDKKEVSGQEFIFDELKAIKFSLENLTAKRDAPSRSANNRMIDYCMRGTPKDEIENLKNEIQENPYVLRVLTREIGADHDHLIVRFTPETADDEISSVRARVRTIAAKFPGRIRRNIMPRAKSTSLNGDLK